MGDSFAIDADDSMFGNTPIRYSDDEEFDEGEGNYKPRKPRLAVHSITSSEFEPFSHFFVVVSKSFHLCRCSMHSLFLRIRTNPEIPIIETSPVWCSESSVDFRAGYALDFTQVPSFSLGEYTPVIEFYRRQSSESELFAFSLLPLRVKEVVQCENLPLTFLYKNDVVDLREFTSGQVVGSITVTIALGFPSHQKFLDPSSELPSAVVIPTPEAPKEPVEEKPVKRVREEIDDDLYSERSSEESRRTKKHRKHRHKKKRAKNAWIQKATAYGWKPPGWVDPDWKDKAREKGWNPPSNIMMSSVAVMCEPGDCRNMKDIVIQTDPVKPQAASSSFISKSSSAQSYEQTSVDDDEDEVFALIDMLNQKKKKAPKEFKPVECVFSIESRPMTRTPVLTLLDVQGKTMLSESSSDDLEIEHSLSQIHSVIEHNFNLSDSDDEDKSMSKSSIMPLNNIDDKLMALQSTLDSSDYEEDEDEAEHMQLLSNHQLPISMMSSGIDDSTSDSDDDDTVAVDRVLEQIAAGDPEFAALMSVYRK